ncbi:hypothetical protein HOU79_gp70 [Vibrio phage 1.224.A._10N.261.48.B1]|uniref:Uncharacterized protein n=1 Tax=Vibrio phage 1.224.A._10N.261.48.B1 TaxID=1881226 RepID=A0A2I7RS27_9CAUD|nr:hypothetical protein HOU79_gp70 [Vibrio phage 1.224.A._10N.261.48.B1]AUR96403.1 hypothetical protein NVP1224A_36 [Vibrio phage 1.224.A._10N.261.48.B1]
MTVLAVAGELGIDTTGSSLNMTDEDTRVIGSTYGIDPDYSIHPLFRKGKMREPNGHNLALYVDRTLEVDEVLWQHTITKDMLMRDTTPLCSGVMATPATARTQIDISVSDTVHGSFVWEIGDKDATIIWPRTSGMYIGDEVVFTVVQTDVDATDITINLIGAYL